MREVFSRSRVTLRCTILETGRESYRLREARKRPRGTAADPPPAVDAGPGEE
jgi:hypothetical protein